MPALSCYREFAPCPALRAHVRAFFTYSVPAQSVGTGRIRTREVSLDGSGRIGAPLLADGQVSIVFTFGAEYGVQGLWSPGGPAGHVIGAMSQARLASHGLRVVQVGAYLKAGRVRDLIPVPAHELTDRVTGLEDVWGSSPEAQIEGGRDDSERVSILEAILLDRVRVAQRSPVRVAGLAEMVAAQGGMLSVEQLAHAAGVSRQRLSKLFRDEVGVSPKLYCRLARFGAALTRMNSPRRWAETAADLGYADQSHLIADFKKFSGLTPAAMVREGRFHPFAG